MRATTRQTRVFQLAALIALVFGALIALPGVYAAAPALSAQDNACLACHGSEGLSRKMPDGEKLSLHVPASGFAESVHAAMGCAACHSEQMSRKHPPANIKAKTVREYSLSKVEACRTCHEEKFRLYEGSIHAALLRAGNPIAPVCTDCHSPHAISPKTAAAPMEQVACRKCHSGVFDAYAGSVHGTARAKSTTSGAPLCAECHNPHEVKVPSTSDQPRNACLACHSQATRVHATWLPNAAHHLDVVSCAACHVPGAQRRVDLRLYDTAAGKRLAEKDGVPQFETRARSADEKGVGLDALALQSLLREFSRDDADTKLMLRGRLELKDGTQTHQLASKSKAVSDCATCHRAGAEAFQSVTVSIVGPDGQPVRYDAQKEVLVSAISVNSVRGFYAIGSTRIKLLDWLLVLAVVSAIAIAVGHQTLRWLFSRHARRLQEEAKRTAGGGAQPHNGDHRPG